jgi:hypothetical protein
VGLVAVALWSAGDVGSRQILVYVGYQAAFVVGPGLLVYRMLGGRTEGWLRQLVFGWAIGYLLEVTVFIATAALGARWLLPVYPLLVVGMAMWSRSRRGAGAPDRRPGQARPGGGAWAVAMVCVIALVHVAIQYFAPSPLPERVNSVAYGLDQVWNLSLAGEAKHHWPMSDPTAAGTPLFYHLFATFDVAATSQVSGLGLPLVFFRLYLVPLVVLACLGLSLAGAAIGRSRWVGPVAAALVLFVGELNLDPHVGYRFANELSDDVFAISPSFLFGLIFFLPALILLHEQCGPAGHRGWRRWTLLGLVLLGCAGSKATILPVLIGGLVLYAAWRGLRDRGVDRRVLGALGLSAGIYLASSAVEYGGAGSYGLSLHVPGAVRQMASISHVAPRASAAAALFWVAAVPVGLVGAYGASLCGVPSAFRHTGRPAPRGHALLLAVLLAGLAPFLLFTHFGLSQVFFAEYGVVAGCLLSAEGLVFVWSARNTRGRGVLALVAVAVAVAGVWLFLAVSTRGSPSAYLDADVALAVGAVVVLAGALRYAGRPGTFIGCALAALLLIGAVSKATGLLVPTATRLTSHQPLYSQTGNGLTAGLRRGLSWIREHTAPSAVVAVNNYRDGSLYWDYGWKVPDDYYYSAMGERRVFLEGWVYAQRAFDIGERDVFLGRKLPFPARLRLNEAVFERRDRSALRTLSRGYGVRYLLIDRVHNSSSPTLDAIARRVFADPDVAIYAVDGRRSPAQRFRAARRRHPPSATTRVGGLAGDRRARS